MASVLRDIAVEHQDFELASVLRDVEAHIKRSLDESQTTDRLDFLVIKKIYNRMRYAEAMLHIIDHSVDPDYVPSRDIPEFANLLEAAAFVEEFNSGRSAHLDEIKFHRCVTALSKAMPTLVERVNLLETALRHLKRDHDAIARRILLITTQVKTPIDRTQAAVRYETEINKWRKRALTCCFCDQEFDAVAKLRLHSSTCDKHPLYKKLQENGQQAAETGAVVAAS